jgi:ribosomal protein L9
MTVVDVKPGFMRNKLYPGKLAVYATEENLAKYGLSRQVRLAARGAAAKRRLAAAHRRNKRTIRPARRPNCGTRSSSSTF